MKTHFVKYNKLTAFLYLFIALILALFFSLAFLFTWFMSFDLTLIDATVVSILTIISILIFIINFKRIWPILASNEPALYISSNNVKINFVNNPVSIPTSEIESVKLVMSGKGQDWLGFVLKESSKIEGNFNTIKKRLAKEYRDEDYNWIVVDMSFIKGSAQELVRELNG